MPISDYTITPWVDLSVSPTGTPDLDAGSLLKVEQRLYDLTEAMQALQGNYEAAADLLTFLKTVDGAGSGLDADLLDGTQLSAIQIRSEKGASNGYASLDVNGLVPTAQLPASGSSVTSVFTRTGNVVAASGDYTATQITNTPAGNIAATNVQTALNELDTEKQALTAKNAASGYAGLDGSTKLSLTQMGTGTPTDKLYLRGDGAWSGAPYICTSGARPSSPHEGMEIYETDTDRLLVNVGTSGSPVWRIVSTVKEIPFSDGRATLTTGDITLMWQARVDIRIIAIRAQVYTAPTGATIIGDLKRATSAAPGTRTSIYTTTANRPVIATSGFSAGTSVALPDTIDIPANDYLIGNIAQIGSTIAGGGYVMQVFYVERG